MQHNESPMQALKIKLKAILDYIDLRSRFVYLDYPLTLNVGDLLINIGTEAFFSEYGIRPERRYCAEDAPQDVPNIDDNVTFLMQGGGNFGDLYSPNQLLRERIIMKYPRNRVIIFPQTVYFENKTKQTESCAVLRSHSNLHIFVRDESSFASLRDSRLNNVTLMPDMAHWLWGSISQTQKMKTESSLYFLRRDQENGSVPKEIAAEAVSSVDWGDCIPMWQKAAFATLARAVIANGRCDHPLDMLPCWYVLRNSIVQHGVSLLSRSNKIVTNRLHAMLLGMLLGKQVTAFDNSYGKLSSYVTTWLKEMPNLTFLGPSVQQ
jgi:pyruvyl transferase EpsO